PKWAAGFQPNSNAPGIFQFDGAMWHPTSEPAPVAYYYGLDQAGNSDSYWFAGARCDNQCTGVLANRNAGKWSSEPIPSSVGWLNDVSFGDASSGLAIGYRNAVLQYRDQSPSSSGSVSSPSQPPPDYQQPDYQPPP